MSTCPDTQNLHHAPVGLNRRKSLIYLASAAIAFALSVAFTWDGEPKYQGHRLSEWLERSGGGDAGVDLPGQVEAQAALQNIGTNALPCLLKWTRYEPSAWRAKLYKKLPAAVTERRMVWRWLQEREATDRAVLAMRGFEVLGTNAVSAIPELEAVMKDTTKIDASERAIIALGHIGEHAIPVLKAGLADSNRSDHTLIVYVFGVMGSTHGTNACLPILLEALNDNDLNVRSYATNAVQGLVPGLLPDAFAPFPQ